eukprot:4941566-Prymnesium_polylepis.1
MPLTTANGQAYPKRQLRAARSPERGRLAAAVRARSCARWGKIPGGAGLAGRGFEREPPISGPH